MPTLPWRPRLASEPDGEYVVMASRLPLRSFARVPLFMGLTVSVVRQLERTEGVVGYSLRAQPSARTFWTLSAWTDADALARFARAMPHLAVMARLRPHRGPTRFETWTCRGSELPLGWDGAVQRLGRPAGSSSPPSTRP